MIMDDIIELWYPSKDSLWKYFKTFFPLPIDRPYIKLSYLVPKEFAHLEGTVIDFETTELPQHSKAKVITAGFFHEKLVEIYQCHIPWMSGKFQHIVRNLVLKRPMPLIGYSPEFEQTFSGYAKPKRKDSFGDLWTEKIWKDILQWEKTENWYTGEPYVYRKKLVDCISSPTNDFLGYFVPKLWAKWSKSFDQRSLFEIIYHNALDLHRESYVAKDLHIEIKKKREEIHNRPNFKYTMLDLVPKLRIE